MTLRGCAVAAAVLLSCICIGAKSYSYRLPPEVTDSVIPLTLPECESPQSVTASVRASATKSASWSLLLSAGADTLTVTLGLRPAGYFDPFDRSGVTITAASGSKILASASPSDGFATSAGEYNTLSVNASADRIVVSGGYHRLTPVVDFANPFGSIPHAISFRADGKVAVANTMVDIIYPPESVAKTAWTSESLHPYLSTAPLDQLEGYWDYLDRKTTPRRAREGGRYTLAVVKSLDRPGTYDILYVAGARVYSDRWRPAMRKGRLIPTDYVDHYDLEWIDATFVERTTDIHASVEQASILTLRFPLFESSLRFTRRDPIQ